MSKDFYWFLRRQLMFVQHRAFSVASFLLLDSQSSSQIRAVLLRLLGAKIGANAFIRGGLRIQDWYFNLTIGDNVFINSDCLLDTSAPITIGDYAEFGYQVTIITGDHKLGPSEHRVGECQPKPVEIGNGAWIGARSTVLPGVVIGPGAVVSAGSLVTQDVGANILVGGVPARAIRALGSE